MTVLAFLGIYKNIKQYDVFIRLLLLLLYENSLVLIKAEDEFVNVHAYYPYVPHYLMQSIDWGKILYL